MALAKLKDKRVYLPIAIIVGGIVAMVGLSSMKKPPEEKAPEDIAPLVKVQPVVMERMALTVHSQGLVTPKYQTQLVAQVAGTISYVAPEFQRGGFIKEGQVLARIEDADYRALVVEAQANLASAQAGLEQEMALGAVARDEWSRIKDRKPTALSLREPQLAQEKARVKAAEAALTRAQKNLERTEIRAPYHALVAAREVGLGTYVNPGSQVGELLSVSQAEVRLPVADNQLRFLIDQGLNSDVRLVGDLEGQKAEWTAKIVRTEGVIDDQSRMAYLVAELINPYGLQVPGKDDKVLNQTTHHPLRFGSYVKAEIAGMSLEQAALIPRHLVVEGKVPVLTDDKTLHFKPVQIVREQGTHVVVTEGVAHNDQLIVSALAYPVEGMKLRLPGEIAEPETKNDNPEALAGKAE